MSWLKRLFGSPVKKSSALRQEPFGEGFLLQDSTGKWIAWVNDAGKELRNLETSDVQVFGGGRVAIQGPGDALPVLWNAQQEVVIPPEYRSYQALIPGRLLIAITEAYTKQLFLWNGERALPEPVAGASRTESKDTVIVFNKAQDKCGLVRVPAEGMPVLEWTEIKGAGLDHFAARKDPNKQVWSLLGPDGSALVDLELASISPPTWQVKEAWKSDPNVPGEVAVCFRTPGMEEGMAVARGTTGELRAFRAGAETVLFPWPG